jgi:hypothetical protein
LKVYLRDRKEPLIYEEPTMNFTEKGDFADDYVLICGIGDISVCQCEFIRKIVYNAKIVYRQEAGKKAYVPTVRYHMLKHGIKCRSSCDSAKKYVENNPI